MAEKMVATGSGHLFSSRSPAVCTNHSERPAIGVCVRCRRQLCSECLTKLQGINHCAPCLAAMTAGLDQPGAYAEPAVGKPSRMLALGLLVVLWLLTWGLLEALLPR